MPWRRTDAVKERTKFVLEWERLFEKNRGIVNLSELCRAYGISRPTGYTWLHRYRDAGRDVRILEDRSRRPLSNPKAMTVAVEATLVAARKLHPCWGPRKLRAWLQDRFPDHTFPSPSTIGEALKRHGLVESRRRRRRRHAPVATAPFKEPITPNGVWCIDFKGHFRTDDGAVCYPLTISDAFSRFLIRCEIVEDPDGDAVRSVLDSAFREFGLPSAIRSDNGPPFASTGAGGLTSLAVWLLRLGVRLERTVPGKRQQNGKHERMHLTLKLETATPAKANLFLQQKAFDLFRREYNEERPHEALELKPPVTRYTPSSRTYPRKLLRPVNLGEECRAERGGFVRWRGEKIFISHALHAEYVRVFPCDDGSYEVSFGAVALGSFTADRLELRLAKRQRVLSLEDEEWMHPATAAA
jgi:putative transposase